MDREANGQFRPGVSGNPGGRPAQLAEVTELARARTPKVIEALYGIVLDPDQPTGARVSAAQVLLDRGYGRPQASVDLHVAGGPSLVDILVGAGKLERDEATAQVDEPDDTPAA